MSSTKVPFFWKNLCALLIFSPPKLKIPSPPLNTGKNLYKRICTLVVLIVGGGTIKEGDWQHLNFL